MSKMISESTPLDLQPTIKNKLRQVTFHPTQFTSPQLKKWTQQSEDRQNLFLKNICKKYAIQQQQIIRQKSSEEVLNQLKDLKRKLRRSLQKQNIQRIMNEKQPIYQNYLGKVLREKTEMIDIGKKYGKKINLKLSLFNEVDQIGNQKCHYKQWYDSNRNNIANSPIYNEINQLLSKKEQKNKHMNSNKTLRNTMDEKLLSPTLSSYGKKKREYNGRNQSKRLNTKL